MTFIVFFISFQQWKKGNTIGSSGVRIKSGNFCSCGEKVGQPHRSADDFRLELRRTGYEEGYTQTSFLCRKFSSPERSFILQPRIVRPGRSVSSLGITAQGITVVGRKEDNGILILPRLFQVGHQFPYKRIQLHDHGCPFPRKLVHFRMVLHFT